MPRTVQLAIQGGGAKICHLLAAMEAVQELERANDLKVTRIAGTSAGAIVACMYAAKIDFAGFRTTLREGLGEKLLRLFKPPGGTSMAYSVLTGKPFWKEEELKTIFDRIFEQAKVRRLSDLKELSGIEVLVVASNMLQGGQILSAQEEFISNALLHSAGLPFCFRTWKGANGGIVDGGICDNFPWEVLAKADISGQGPIVGIVFDSLRPSTPTNCVKFSAGLLDLAIDNTMERAKQRLGKDYLFSISPTVTTFDFPKALKEGLSVAYDHTKAQAKAFFEKFARNVTPNSTGPDVWDENLTIMTRLGEIYTRQHKPSRFHYDLCELEVTANSLHNGQPDVVRYSAQFRTDKDPIYCHAIAVSKAKHTTQIDETSWWMFDENKRPIKCLYLPMQGGTTKPSRELLIFFDPVLEPHKGPFTLSIRDHVEGLMKQLKLEKKDDMVLRPQRAVGPIKQINLVLHYPNSYNATFVPKEDGQPGAQMSPFELSDYRGSEPDGFRTIGWKGTDLDPELPFGVNVVLA
jgi:predicted acylesterase/phospholipase RssA